MLERQNVMCSSLALRTNVISSETEIGRALARTKTNVILIIEEGGALVQCQVSSGVAAAMLAPLKGKAAGQFRALAGNLVEIDALVTLPMAMRMLKAKDGAQARLQLN
ncbi:hypothetical protein I6F14_33230 [Bradyrhizobium sp. IC3069]|uniref:hypothetical protein n=1 Tax=unclassified Bradyrhizobium TaxID=2631580 RepID=UPI001CD7F643|nr:MULTISPECIES: hypothetical protein [unclassified Bradyrhizobium]MCA1365134.1 hypothetical protein [Bradyrhizobium sp. IC4059]MCA1522798.1 hypothetical protein [Bradyrhizobium sp. IC3069]